jgi:3-isopropylmalate dehydratase small subunit
MIINGTIWRFGDHIDTDVILPARFLNVSDETELARRCFADIRPDFAGNVQTGDVVVGGVNFGCGSSREHAPLGLRAAGVGVIIAESFARIFYRNAFNIGLPLLESPEAAAALRDGGRAEVNLASGQIRCLDTDKTFSAGAVPDFMQRIIDAGGLMALVQQDRGWDAGEDR